MDFRTLDRTWIAAEIGVNHEGDEAVAIDLINKAAYAGADAVKFQTFEIEHYISTEQPERYQRTKGFQLSRDAFRRLKAAADAAGVLFFSTPLSFHDVAFLDEIAPIFKVSSGDLTFLNLIETIAATNKPMIVSTGLGADKSLQRLIRSCRSGRQPVMTARSCSCIASLFIQPMPTTRTCETSNGLRMPLECRSVTRTTPWVRKLVSWLSPRARSHWKSTSPIVRRTRPSMIIIFLRIGRLGRVGRYGPSG